MLKRISTYLPFTLLLLNVVAIGIATIIEEFQGTQEAQKLIYHAVWFQGCWAAVVLSGTYLLYKFRKMLFKASVLLHVSFILILAGALLTSLTSQKGMIHLRAGEPCNSYTLEDGSMKVLPFTLQLDTFQTVYYPGTEAPQDYRSKVKCTEGKETLAEATISMNHILTVKNYRLYQSSYDEDEKGSWLSLNYDPYGTPVTYIGYALLAISMIWMLFHSKGRFRQLLSHPILKKSGILGMLLLACNCSLQAAPLPVFNRAKADSLGYKQVIYNNRVMPLNTLARDFVKKIYGKPSFKNLTAEQVLLGWMVNPDDWQHIALVKIKNQELRHLLNVPEYCCLTDLFDSQNTYRLQGLWEKEKNTNSKLAQSIQEVDEKVGLIMMATQGTLFKALPEDGSVQRLSDTAVKAEIFYNKVDFTKILFMVNLTLGIICFLLFLYRLLQSQSTTHKWVGLLDATLKGCLWVVTGIQILSYGLRWYIAGNVPLSNGFETMQFIALSVLVITCLLYRRIPYILSFGFLLSGFTLLVSYLGQMNPQITPLMPVLHSPWLSSHVSVIMFSYALFGFIAMNAILALSLRKDKYTEQRELLTVISEILLYPATFCLGIGIFLGAVWANVSWGSYWSWDPKESWALISFLLYGLAFHRKSLKWLNQEKAFHWYMLFCFASILMTYFGVNYLLGGMHSYAGT